MVAPYSSFHFLSVSKLAPKCLLCLEPIFLDALASSPSRISLMRAYLSDRYLHLHTTCPTQPQKARYRQSTRLAYQFRALTRPQPTCGSHTYPLLPPTCTSTVVVFPSLEPPICGPYPSHAMHLHSPPTSIDLIIVALHLRYYLVQLHSLTF